VQRHYLAKRHLPEGACDLAIRGIRGVQRDRRRSRCPCRMRLCELGHILSAVR
jgi:hypothetical protein